MFFFGMLAHPKVSHHDSYTIVFYNLSPNIFGFDYLISWKSWGYGAPLGRPSPRRQFIKFIFYFILHHIRNMYVHTSLHTTYIDDICTNVSWYIPWWWCHKKTQKIRAITFFVTPLLYKSVHSFVRIYSSSDLLLISPPFHNHPLPLPKPQWAKIWNKIAI